MKKYKFTRIKVYSSEEYFYNLLKKKYYNNTIFSGGALCKPQEHFIKSKNIKNAGGFCNAGNYRRNGY